MKPVDQAVLHEPESGRFGDCMRACVASLLEMECETVPHFLHDGDESQYNARLQAFLASHGLCAMTFTAWSIHTYKADVGITAPIYHIISGPSPRFPGQSHAVVGVDGQFCHDPHPDRSYIQGEPEKWEYTFLVSLSNGPTHVCG
jgi:hypothetical protein